MKAWVQIIIIYFIGLICLLLIALNVKSYNQKLETGQIKAKNYVVDQLH